MVDLTRQQKEYGTREYLTREAAIARAVSIGGGYVRDCVTFWGFEGRACPGSFTSLYHVDRKGNLRRCL